MNFFLKRRRIPAFAAMCIVIGLSSVPSDVVGDIMAFVFGPPEASTGKILHMDKLIHFCLYSMLGFSYAWAISLKKWVAKPMRYYAIVIVLSGTFGVMDEHYQLYSNMGRQFEYADIVADVLGSVCAASLFLWKGVVFKKAWRRIILRENPETV